MSKISLTINNNTARDILAKYEDLDDIRQYLNYLRTHATEMICANLQGK